MNRMKLLLASAGLVSVLAGCAAPIHVTDGNRERIFVPCADDAFCFRNTYGIVREKSCNEFPISYRNNEYEFRPNRYEWIYQSTEVVPVSTRYLYR